MKYNPVFYAKNGKIGVSLGDEDYDAEEGFFKEVDQELASLKIQLKSLLEDNERLRCKIGNLEADIYKERVKTLKLDMISSLFQGDRW